MQWIADNLHALDPRVADALARRDPAPIQALAERLVAAGADRIDLNPGHLSRRRADGLAFLVDAVQQVTHCPLVLDSPEPEVLRLALPRCRQPPLVDALTGEPHRLAGHLPLAVEHDLDLVLLLVDERSAVPATLDEKVGLALELVQACTDAGLPLSRLIVDPVLPNLRWPDADAQIDAAVELVGLLASGALLGTPLRTMAGLSNLRSGLRRQLPLALESAVLKRLEEAGLTHALVDVLSSAVHY